MWAIIMTAIGAILSAPSVWTLVRERGQRRSEWVSIEESVRRVKEPGLKDIIASFVRELVGIRKS